MDIPFAVLRQALGHLSLEPDEQRKALAGAVVPDELALDLGNAIESLGHTSSEDGATLPADVVADVLALQEALSAPSGAHLWTVQALEQHPTWALARSEARRLLPLLPHAL